MFDKLKDFFTDSSHKAETKRLAIANYLSGILIAIMCSNYIFNFKDNLIATLNPLTYSYFLMTTRIIFDVLLFVYVTFVMFLFIFFLLYALTDYASDNYSFLEKINYRFLRLARGSEHRCGNTFTWLFLLTLILLATQPHTIQTEIDILISFIPAFLREFTVCLCIFATLIFLYKTFTDLIARFVQLPIMITSKNVDKED